MSFIDTLFPRQYGYGSVGGPHFKTEIVATANKREVRNRVWVDERRKYDLSMTARTQAQVNEIMAFHLAMGGPEHSFRFWDFLDWEFSATQIAVGDGATSEFQITKTYAAGSASHVRTITKPRAGLQIFVNGIANGGAVVNTNTGKLTGIGTPSDGAVVTATGRFDVPVRFVEDELRWRVVDRTDNDGDEGDYLYLPESLTLIEVIGE